MKRIIAIALAAAMLCACNSYKVTSPQGDISVKVTENLMTVSYKGAVVQTVGIQAGKPSKATKAVRIDEEYDMVVGKSHHCSNSAFARTLTFADCEMEVRAYNDGVTYRFIGKHPEVSYQIADGTKRWLLKEKQDYEGLYPLSDKAEAGVWYYPALFELGDGVFGLYTESGVYRGQCGSHLVNAGEDAYNVVAADEEFPEGTSAWRVMIVGGLSDLVASTLVTDVAEPSVLDDTSWIEPGVSAWIYWSANHGSSDYAQVKDFIDLAAEMHWPYHLIDGGWPMMRNGGTMEDAVAYAREKGIKTNVWYNSAQLFGWSEMLDPETREAELSRIEAIGVTGVKIDFFKDDTSNSMEYYMDLVEAAAKHHLLVDFHGCTLPRGWERTYPNLMTYEAVMGAEWYNNGPQMTDAAAAHNATLPFTRNIVGPMDYTAGTFSDSQHPHITTWAHELALPVIFESGLVHMPDRPSAYYALSAEVKDFLGNLPSTWDETRLIAGYPGEYVVLARRNGDAWYIGAINGSDEPRHIDADLGCLGVDAAGCELYTDGEDGKSILSDDFDGLALSIDCLPRGGFVAVVRQ